MSKFYVGQKVLVTGSTYFPNEVTKSLIGKILEIRTVSEGVIIVYNEDKSKIWGFNPSDLQPIPETPETLTVNGVEYIRKPEPVVDHEWKFGDVAVHKEYGVGIVTRELDDDGDLYFSHCGIRSANFVKPSSLTFIRRADLSV